MIRMTGLKPGRTKGCNNRSYSSRWLSKILMVDRVRRKAFSQLKQVYGCGKSVAWHRNQPWFILLDWIWVWDTWTLFQEVRKQNAWPMVRADPFLPFQSVPTKHPNDHPNTRPPRDPDNVVPWLEVEEGTLWNWRTHLFFCIHPPKLT